MLTVRLVHAVCGAACGFKLCSCCGNIGEMEHGRRDCVCVGINGAEGRNAWAVAPMLLTAEGTNPLRTAVQSVSADAWMNCVVSLSAWGRRFNFW